VSYAGSDNVEWSDRGEPTLKFRMFCHEDIPQF